MITAFRACLTFSIRLLQLLRCVVIVDISRYVIITEMATSISLHRNIVILMTTGALGGVYSQLWLTWYLVTLRRRCRNLPNLSFVTLH